MQESLLTVREAASSKGVTRTAIYAAIAEGRLPHTKVLGRIGIREADLSAWTPMRYGGRPGTKGRGGRPVGHPMSAEAKARLSASQKARWARQGTQAEP